MENQPLDADGQVPNGEGLTGSYDICIWGAASIGIGYGQIAG